MQDAHDTQSVVKTVMHEWHGHMAHRIRQQEHHAKNFENRRGFYDLPLSFPQYLALSAYLDCHDLGSIPYKNDAEKAEAQRGTFGKAYPDATDVELDTALADHMQAMAKAYTADIESALGDIRL